MSTLDNPENTGARILAFLHSVRPLRGCAGIAESDTYLQGRNAIEKLAWASQGSMAQPATLLSQGQCADVCRFLADSEPFDWARWGTEPPAEPSPLVGLQFVLETLERSLRPCAEPPESFDAKHQRAAQSIRLAIEHVDGLLQDTEEGSELEKQMQEALGELHSTLEGLEWKPEEHVEDSRP